MSTETIRLIREGGMEVGEREIIYLSLFCHHQNGSCIKMGSDESHFNVSLLVRDKVTRQCPQTTTILKRKESRCRESKLDRAQAALLLTILTWLGQTGCQAQFGNIGQVQSTERSSCQNIKLPALKFVVTGRPALSTQ